MIQPVKRRVSSMAPTITITPAIQSIGVNCHGKPVSAKVRSYTPFSAKAIQSEEAAINAPKIVLTVIDSRVAGRLPKLRVVTAAKNAKPAKCMAFCHRPGSCNTRLVARCQSAKIMVPMKHSLAYHAMLVMPSISKRRSLIARG